MTARAITTEHRLDTLEAHRRSIERVVMEMRTHFSEMLSLDDMAQIAAMSKFHFHRVFEEITETTPLHFLACIRIERAKELLLSTETSVTDICMEVGYSSLGSFSTSFSELVGLPPKCFRERVHSQSAEDFHRSVMSYIAAKRGEVADLLDGELQAPTDQRGFFFVGGFECGVPQGIPQSGTVMLTAGSYRIRRPRSPTFHLLAVLLPYSTTNASALIRLPVALVGRRKVNWEGGPQSTLPPLSLREPRPTDPPILTYLGELTRRI
jgi:AraC-like DNA-binding protein